MINKIKELYPKHLIFIIKNGKVYDLDNKEVINVNKLKRHSYVIINEDSSYEVFTKVK